MSNHPNARTVIAVSKMIEEMQVLVEHPRIQQKTWVAKGKEWLPILHHAKEDLEREVKQQDFLTELYQTLLLALERLGLRIEKRDDTSWGYRWHNGTLIGSFATRADAVETALRERLR